MPSFAQGKASKENSHISGHEEEIDVHGTTQDHNCPIALHRGNILGASHGVSTKYLPSVNVPYREHFTYFSVADGEKTYLVRRQGELHAKDYVGLIVTSPCRQTIADVVRIGDIKSAGAADEAAVARN
ncbi:hypothetical protein FAI40_01230 [Acetobacteraceae bacterium]|nr:hypothetical protein FAI40_01230 [Acetobacteraceae bacterium]